MQQKVSMQRAPEELSSKGPLWRRLLPYGQIQAIDQNQPLILDDHGAVSVLAHFADQGKNMVIDYEHLGLNGVQSPEAGRIEDMQWRGRGGLWVQTKWTEKAAEFIENGEYRYLSSGMLFNETDRRIVAVIGVALTNAPMPRKIKPIAAKLEQPRLSHASDNVLVNKAFLPNGQVIDDTLLAVAKRLGIDQPTLMRYGPKPVAQESATDQTIKKVAYLLGISEKDLR